MQHHEMFRHRVPFFLETFRKNRPMTTANPTPDMQSGLHEKKQHVMRRF